MHKLPKLNYIKLHLLLVFVKCTLVTTHSLSYQIEMCSLRLIYFIRMEIHAKINEAVK